MRFVEMRNVRVRYKDTHVSNNLKLLRHPFGYLCNLLS